MVFPPKRRSIEMGSSPIILLQGASQCPSLLLLLLLLLLHTSGAELRAAELHGDAHTLGVVVEQAARHDEVGSS